MSSDERRQTDRHLGGGIVGWRSQPMSAARPMVLLAAPLPAERNDCSHVQTASSPPEGGVRLPLAPGGDSHGSRRCSGAIPDVVKDVADDAHPGHKRVETKGCSVEISGGLHRAATDR